MLVGIVLYSVLALAFITTVKWLLSSSKDARYHHNTAPSQIINDSLAEDPRLAMSGLEIAKNLRLRKFTCVDIVTAFIDHIEKINPLINAVCGKRYEEALADAKIVDEMLANPGAQDIIARLPYFGVPFIGKEVMEYPGLPFTMGLKARSEIKGEAMNPALARVIRLGGAILIATGNISEACMWYESNNYVYGRSKNPYDLSRTVGGSSGGNCAIVSALGGPFAITSDVGGSTRIPSFFNGLFGHKPTGGSIPNHRTIPLVTGKTNHYCQLGPSARHPEDLMPLLRLMSGPITNDEEVLDEFASLQNGYNREFEWPETSSVDISSLKVLVVWDQPGSNFPVSSRDKELVHAQDRVVESLKSLGCKVEARKFKGMDNAFDIWSEMLQASQEHEFAHTISDGKGETISPWYELLKWFWSAGHSSDHTLPALGLAAVDRLLRKVNPKFLSDKVIQMGEDLKKEMEEAMEGNTIVVFPTLPKMAPKHGPLPLLLRFADAGATGIFNVLEFPSTAVPTGLSSEGLPTGVQIVAGHGKDHLTIATAEYLHKAGVAGWHPPLKGEKSKDL